MKETHKNDTKLNKDKLKNMGRWANWRETNFFIENTSEIKFFGGEFKKKSNLLSKISLFIGHAQFKSKKALKHLLLIKPFFKAYFKEIPHSSAYLKSCPQLKSTASLLIEFLMNHEWNWENQMDDIMYIQYWLDCQMFRFIFRCDSRFPTNFFCSMIYALVSYYSFLQ